MLVDSTRSIILSLVALFAISSADAASPALRACKRDCGALVAGDCAALRAGKFRKCRSRIWKSCKKGQVECLGVTTTTIHSIPGTTTTLRPGVTTTTTRPTSTTSTTNTTLPLVADYEGFYEFSGQIVSGTCGFVGVDSLLFATLHISNSFGTTVVGTIDEDEGSTFFYEDVTGTATYPTWETLTNSPCAVENVAGTRCGYVWTQMTGLPNYTFESPPHEVPGAMEKRWDNPNCSVRWEGTWSK